MEPSEAIEHVQAGTLCVIAAVTEQRLPAFAGVTTLKEQGINVRGSGSAR